MKIGGKNRLNSKFVEKTVKFKNSRDKPLKFKFWLEKTQKYENWQKKPLKFEN